MSWPFCVFGCFSHPSAESKSQVRWLTFNRRGRYGSLQSDSHHCVLHRRNMQGDPRRLEFRTPGRASGASCKATSARRPPGICCKRYPRAAWTTMKCLVRWRSNFSLPFCLPGSRLVWIGIIWGSCVSPFNFSGDAQPDLFRNRDDELLMSCFVPVETLKTCLRVWR